MFIIPRESREQNVDQDPTKYKVAGRHHHPHHRSRVRCGGWKEKSPQKLLTFAIANPYNLAIKYLHEPGFIALTHSSFVPLHSECSFGAGGRDCKLVRLFPQRSK